MQQLLGYCRWRMYGTTIRRALESSHISIKDAAAAMGYERPDMLYRILRDDAAPSLDKLQRLADRMNQPIGDLLPNSGANPLSDEMRDILTAISGVAGQDRDEVIAALAVNARVLANAYRRRDEKSSQRPSNPTSKKSDAWGGVDSSGLSVEQVRDGEGLEHQASAKPAKHPATEREI